MGKIAAIGGSAPPCDLQVIDTEIVRLTGKERPKLLYVPAACGDDLKNFHFIQNSYGETLGCQLDTLLLLKESPAKESIREKVFAADIIYVEGGSITTLMTSFEHFQMAEVLEAAYRKGVVLAGKSAGAICWGTFFIENKQHKISCLGLLDYVLYPHFDVKGSHEELGAIVAAEDIIGIGIENHCAVCFKDEEYRVIAANKDAKAYKVYRGTNVQRMMLDSSSAAKWKSGEDH
ncbi:MAG TPA: Type 1 glutamine amidotransferase-like domain-containing protein [Bacillales bacterium]|nr:Type 1 glutamine amidotransferase-like domain-containing protein [Bacillales bacterium]